MGKLLGKLMLRTIQKHTEEKTTTWKSVCLSSISLDGTSEKEAGGSRQAKFQQYYIDGSCVLGYQESPVFTWQSNMNVLFLDSCTAASLQLIRGVSAGIQ
jgi:hypothetical protein